MSATGRRISPPPVPTVRRCRATACADASRISSSRAAIRRSAWRTWRLTIATPVEDVATGAACRADDVELATVLAMFGGKDAGQGDGLEFLVDPAGTLRAVWAPGDKPDWGDADVMEREIAAIRNAPAAT